MVIVGNLFVWHDLVLSLSAPQACFKDGEDSTREWRYLS